MSLIDVSGGPIAAVLAVSGGLLLFAALFAALSLALAAASGWRALARRHRGEGEVAGERFTFASGRFNRLASYSGVLTVSIGADGISLSPMRLVRIGHAPLTIPWSSVRSIEESRLLIWRRTALGIDSGDGSLVRVELFGAGIADAIERFAPL